MYMGESLGFTNVLYAVVRCKVAKHSTLDVGDEHFSFERDRQSIDAEAALDGLYVVRTSLTTEPMPRDEVVRSYKQLTQIHDERCIIASIGRISPSSSVGAFARVEAC